MGGSRSDFSPAPPKKTSRLRDELSRRAVDSSRRREKHGGNILEAASRLLAQGMRFGKRSPSWQDLPARRQGKGVSES